MQWKNITLSEALLMGLGVFFVLAAPLNNSLFLYDTVSRLTCTLPLLAAIILVVYGGEHRGSGFYLLIFIAFGFLVATSSSTLTIESVVNNPEYESILGADRKGFGSTFWSLFNVVTNLSAVLLAAKLTFLDKKREAEQPRDM